MAPDQPSSRRTVLKATGGLLGVGAVPGVAVAQQGTDSSGKEPQPLAEPQDSLPTPARDVLSALNALTSVLFP